MLCALTVRKLKPGAEEDFRSRFIDASEEAEFPPGWRRFYALRNVEDEQEVITFGFFDGTLEELRQGQRDLDYESRRAELEELIDAVGADGIYEVFEERTMG